MRCIADATVLLPLLTEGHAHQAPAADWRGACDDAEVGLSLPVRMALPRLLWTDAWLAALAQALDCEMVTFDRGFRSFSKLKLRLLEPAV